MAKNSEFAFTTSQIRGSAFTPKGAGRDTFIYHTGETVEYITHTHSQPLMCSSSISYKYPWTIGAAYPTTVPHSQSHAARCSSHMAPSSQPLLADRPIHHGVPPRGEVGGSGWPDPIHWDWAHSSRPRSGQWRTRFVIETWWGVASKKHYLR